MSQKVMTSENNIIYQGKNGEIILREDRKHETIWASQGQIAKIFGVGSQAIAKHIKNIYEDGELFESSTCSKMEQVQNEGGRRVKRKINYYNLDIIIAVGYRINGVIGTKFRRWENGVLKQYITDGIAINKSLSC